MWGVLQLIEPLEADGTLVKRSRELLEIEINRFVVLEHDGVIVGCAALYPFAEEAAGELACLAVHPGDIAILALETAFCITSTYRRAGST
jgi:amino-acid N-acetyltransferase